MLGILLGILYYFIGTVIFYIYHHLKKNKTQVGLWPQSDPLGKTWEMLAFVIWKQGAGQVMPGMSMVDSCS